MKIPRFKEIISLSNQQIAKEIIQTENQILDIYIKKTNINRSNTNLLKPLKHRLAQLKTLLTMRLKAGDSQEKNMLEKLITK
jgi:ribosomal protein L29